MLRIAVGRPGAEIIYFQHSKNKRQKLATGVTAIHFGLMVSVLWRAEKVRYNDFATVAPPLIADSYLSWTKVLGPYAESSSTCFLCEVGTVT